MRGEEPGHLGGGERGLVPRRRLVLEDLHDLGALGGDDVGSVDVGGVRPAVPQDLAASVAALVHGDGLAGAERSVGLRVDGADGGLLHDPDPGAPVPVALGEVPGQRGPVAGPAGQHLPPVDGVAELVQRRVQRLVVVGADQRDDLVCDDLPAGVLPDRDRADRELSGVQRRGPDRHLVRLRREEHMQLPRRQQALEPRICRPLDRGHSRRPPYDPTRSTHTDRGRYQAHQPH